MSSNTTPPPIDTYNYAKLVIDAYKTYNDLSHIYSGFDPKESVKDNPSIKEMYTLVKEYFPSSPAVSAIDEAIAAYMEKHKDGHTTSGWSGYSGDELAGLVESNGRIFLEGQFRVQQARNVDSGSGTYNRTVRDMRLFEGIEMSTITSLKERFIEASRLKYGDDEIARRGLEEGDGRFSVMYNSPQQPTLIGAVWVDETMGEISPIIGYLYFDSVTSYEGDNYQDADLLDGAVFKFPMVYPATYKDDVNNGMYFRTGVLEFNCTFPLKQCDRTNANRKPNARLFYEYHYPPKDGLLYQMFMKGGIVPAVNRSDGSGAISGLGMLHSSRVDLKPSIGREGANIPDGFYKEPQSTPSIHVSPTQLRGIHSSTDTEMTGFRIRWSNQRKQNMSVAGDYTDKDGKTWDEMECNAPSQHYHVIPETALMRPSYLNGSLEWIKATQRRFWGVRGKFLHYTRDNLVNSWGLYDFFAMEGDILGYTTLETNIIVCTTVGIYIIKDDVNFSMKKISNYCYLSHYTGIGVIEGNVYYVSNHAVYAIGANKVTDITSLMTFKGRWGRPLRKVVFGENTIYILGDDADVEGLSSTSPLPLIHKLMFTNNMIIYSTVRVSPVEVIPPVENVVFGKEYWIKGTRDVVIKGITTETSLPELKVPLLMGDINVCQAGGIFITLVQSIDNITGYSKHPVTREDSREYMKLYVLNGYMDETQIIDIPPPPVTFISRAVNTSTAKELSKVFISSTGDGIVDIVTTVSGKGKTNTQLIKLTDDIEYKEIQLNPQQRRTKRVQFTITGDVEVFEIAMSILTLSGDVNSDKHRGEL